MKIPKEFRKEKWVVQDKIKGTPIIMTFKPYKGFEINSVDPKVQELVEKAKIHTNSYQVLVDLASDVVHLHGVAADEGIKIYEVVVPKGAVPPVIVEQYYAMYHKDFFAPMEIYDNYEAALKHKKAGFLRPYTRILSHMPIPINMEQANG